MYICTHFCSGIIIATLISTTSTPKPNPVNDGRYRWTCRPFLSTEECHASLCLCLRASCFPAVCCVNYVLIIDLTAAEASCWVCVYSYFKLKLRCRVCVCVWLFVPLPPSIGPQQGGGWFTGLVDGWVGGGRWSWWSHHSGICAAEVKPHTR